ncbi:MAG: hypothetical protein ABIR06_13755 [Cyclobacteriaceae bacterium]
MTKFLVRSILSLCILVLSGSSQLYAHACDASSKLSERLERQAFEPGDNNLLFSKKFAASERDKTFIVEPTEGKEEEEHDQGLASRKKNRLSNHNFVAVFCALTRGYFFSYIKEILIYSKHFSDLPSQRRHLIFQLFII